MNLKSLTDKAQRSTFYLWLLNFGLSRMVPFNAPHRLRIVKIGDNNIVAKWPYIRKNLNHIKGLHACGLATLSEFVSGFGILRKLSPDKFRIIMKSLHMDYYYQGKMDALADFSLSDKELEEKIFEPVKQNGVTDFEAIVETRDLKGNLISTGRIVWQIKSWEKVKTKI